MISCCAHKAFILILIHNPLHQIFAREHILSSVATSSRQMSLLRVGLGWSGYRARNLWQSKPRLFSFLLIIFQSPFSDSYGERQKIIQEIFVTPWLIRKSCVVMWGDLLYLWRIKTFPPVVVNAQLLLSVPDFRTSSTDEHFQVGGGRPGVNRTYFHSLFRCSEGTHGQLVLHGDGTLTKWFLWSIYCNRWCYKAFILVSKKINQKTMIKIQIHPLPIDIIKKKKWYPRHSDSYVLTDLRMSFLGQGLRFKRHTWHFPP